MAGNFHVGPLLLSLQQAAVSGRHVLLAGPSGAGKELCAQALAIMMGAGRKPLSLTAHNAARFTSEEEAASTLFGIGSKVFSNVDPRPGVVEQAHGGALFLDEIHNLPERVQRSLLRVIEDGLLSRIGQLIVVATLPGDIPRHAQLVRGTAEEFPQKFTCGLTPLLEEMKSCL